jgi:hypothetical protein
MPDVLDIASLPGMPQLLLGTSADVAPIALVADSLSALAGFGVPVWGIYQNGVPVVIADTVADLGYTKAYAISDFPVEQGAFQTFDKVEQPFEARIRFVSGGSSAAREALIESVEAIIGDLEFYEVATPEKIYFNANIVREEYRRTTGGLLTIEVSVQEIRLPSTGSGFNPTDPASADPVNLGTLTPQDATPSEMAAAGLTPVTTPAPLGGGISGLPVSSPSSGGIGSA